MALPLHGLRSADSDDDGGMAGAGESKCPHRGDVMLLICLKDNAGVQSSSLAPPLCTFTMSRIRGAQVMQIVNNESNKTNKCNSQRIWMQDEARGSCTVDFAQAEGDRGVLRPSECIASGSLLCLSKRRHYYSLWITEG